MRETEWHFASLTDQDVGEIIEKVREAGWSLRFIYLDDGENRFLMQKQGEDFIREAEETAKENNAKMTEKVLNTASDGEDPEHRHPTSPRENKKQGLS